MEGVLAVGLLPIAVFAGLLLFAGITGVRRRRHGLPDWLTLIVGVLLAAGVVIAVVALVARLRKLIVWSVLVGFPAAYLALGLAVFLAVGWRYRRLVARRPQSYDAVDAVVVLGAGLRGDQVTPLLARRLERGRRAYLRAKEAGRDPVIVVSGGQGPDEIVSEAEAMAKYLARQGVPSDAVVLENRSRNTAENLEFSSRLLADRGLTGPVVVATSDYHAPRAAMVMRRSGLDGVVVGSSTPAYYWPSATIREYAATLRDHLVVNLAALAICWFPVILWAGTTLSH